MVQGIPAPAYQQLGCHLRIQRGSARRDPAQRVDAQLTVPRGPYALTVDSGGGPQPSIGIPADPQAHRSVTVSSGGGSLSITPAG